MRLMEGADIYALAENLFKEFFRDWRMASFAEGPVTQVPQCRELAGRPGDGSGQVWANGD
jgi:hypothetical protein